MGRALWASSLVDDVNSCEDEAVGLVGAELGEVRARDDVAQRAARRADEVVVGSRDVRVVALRPCPGGHLDHLAHRDELVQGVVDGREAYLGKQLVSATVDRVRAQVDVLAVEHLGDDAALGRDPPLSLSKPLQKIADRVPLVLDEPPRGDSAGLPTLERF